VRHIGPPVKAVNVKFASKDLILYVISRPESWSVPQKKRRPQSVCAAPRLKNLLNPSPHDPRLDLFHGFAQGSVAEVALRDLEEAGAGPAGLEECEVFEGRDAVMEAAREEDG